MMTAFPWSSFTLMPMNSVVLPMCTIDTLDLLFTSHPTIIDKCKALPALGRSDHDTVLIDLALTAHQQRSSHGYKLFVYPPW
jgi:hypothetical protein